MKLNAPNISAAYGSHDTRPLVVAFCQPIRIVLRLRDKGMDKVNAFPRFDVGKQASDPIAAAIRGTETIPTDMRNLALATVRISGRNGDDPSPHQPQAGRATEFVAAFEQHLHADANSQKRPTAFGESTYGLDQVSFRQAFHARSERTDPRKDQTPRRTDGRRGVSEHNIGAEMPNGPGYRKKVPGTVIDQCNAGSHAARTGKPSACACARNSANVAFP